MTDLYTLLQQHPRGLTVRDVARLLGVTRHRAEDALMGLVGLGLASLYVGPRVVSSRQTYDRSRGGWVMQRTTVQARIFRAEEAG